jgi:hypothetical protein
MKNIYLDIRLFFHKHPGVRFVVVLMLIIAYALYIGKSNGLKDGFLISFLTWSFFVLCTPIADAGILIDLPMRIVANVKMIYSEIAVWVIAILLNIFTYFYNPSIYENTIILSLFKHIIDKPFPYFIVIILSAFGTFLSIYVADSFFNPKIKKKESFEFLSKYKIYIFIFIFILILVVYDFLLNKLGINIPLF